MVWIRPDVSSTDNRPQYPYNSVRSFESGHYEEYDNTPDNERIRVQHRSGTYKEYQATGNCVHHIVGNGYHIVIKDQNVKIDGVCKVEILKDAEIHVGGDMTLMVDGDYNQVVKGNYNVTVGGNHRTECSGAVKATATDVHHESTGDLTVSGNLTVCGKILGQTSIHANHNLTAGGHLSITGSLNAKGLIPTTGGEPLPHIITGMFPTLGMMIDTVGPIQVASAEAVAVEAGMAIDLSAGGAIGMDAGADVFIGAAAAVEVIAGAAVTVDATVIKLN